MIFIISTYIKEPWSQGRVAYLILCVYNLKRRRYQSNGNLPLPFNASQADAGLLSGMHPVPDMGNIFAAAAESLKCFEVSTCRRQGRQ